ncbi:MAG: ATP-binding cassette domain-containing protein [Clostridiales bacterium]|nr:ATP-binding cassette domain-containing protein [Clostridiales bacterium]
MIELVNLTKTFKDGKNAVPFVALDNVSLQIEKGDIYGIIGLSGAGKSTLIRCVNLLEKPDSGNIFIDGEDITLKNKKELNLLRKKLSMIFQSFNLFEQRTALKNVCFPLELVKTPKKEAEKRGLELLDRVGLRDKANAYPSQLSGGQKQRVAIARALASNPEYLLCDEPTSALDTEATESVLQILKQINKEQGITVAIITHELSVITKLCNKVAVIENGRICEFGKVSEVFNNPKTEQTKRLIKAFTIEIPKEDE